MPITPKRQSREANSMLIQSHHQLWDKDSEWRATGESLRELLLPNQSEIDMYTSTKGYERTHQVFSSTAPIAAPRLASHLAGNVTPSRVQFFEFEAPSRDVDEMNTEDWNWLQDESRALYTSLQDSNYFGEMLKFWLSLVVFGTGAIFSDEHPRHKGEFFFHTIPYGMYVIDEAIDGLLARVDRRFKWTLSKIVSKWGLENIHPSWQQEFKNTPFMEKELLHIVRENTIEDHKMGVPKKRQVASYYIDTANEYLLEVGSFDEMPIQVGRWFQAAGEDMGRGPGHDALADVRSDNEIARMALNGLALSTQPPVIGRHEGVIGIPTLRPNSISWVMEQGDIQPWNPGIRIDIQSYGQDRLQSSINRAFFQDIINITQNQPQGKTPVSATQINANIDLMLPVLGPFLSNVEREGITPQMNRCFSIRSRAGRIQPPPPNLLQLFERRGGLMNIAIKGPIAKAIKKTNLESMDSVLTRMNTMSAVWPSMIDRLHEGRWLNLTMDAENAPVEMIKTPEELQALQEQRAKAEAEAKEDQGLKNASEVIKNVGSVPNEQE